MNQIKKIKNALNKSIRTSICRRERKACHALYSVQRLDSS